MLGPSQAALLAALVALLCHTARAVDISLGTCTANKQVVQNFDVSRYMGQWYELEKYWQVFQLNGKCVKAQYSLDSASSRVTVKNSMIDKSTNQEKSIQGFAVLTNPNANPAEGKLDVTFNIPVVGNRKAPYWVLDTDYDNYALVYSCSSYLGFIKTESAWILSRTPNATSAVQQDIENAIRKAALNRKSFQTTVQNC